MINWRYCASWPVMATLIYQLSRHENSCFGKRKIRRTEHILSSSIGKLWACCSVSFNHAAAAAFLLTTAGNEVPLLFSNNGCPISRRAEREQSLYSAVVLRERRLRSALLVCAPTPPRALLQLPPAQRRSPPSSLRLGEHKVLYYTILTAYSNKNPLFHSPPTTS